MNKTVKWVLIGTGILVISGALVFGGFGLGRMMFFRNVNNAYGPGMTGWTNTQQPDGSVLAYGSAMMRPANAQPAAQSTPAYGPGMMGNWSNNNVAPYGPGMMGNWNNSEGYPYGPGMMSGHRGMMGNWSNNNVAPYGPGMMGGGMMSGYNGGLANVDPLTIEAAQAAIEDYLAALGNDDLELHEVMIFDNQAYGEIVEKSTGIGAMEVLVDPVTLAVYPEHGPNMMWNLKYSPMVSGGYGMMGGYGPQSSVDPNTAMPVSATAAIEAAQTYLDSALPGTTVSDHADAFYGYYTLHILRDGDTIGMLGVNGFSGQVFLHSWHGDFIEMMEFED